MTPKRVCKACKTEKAWSFAGTTTRGRYEPPVKVYEDETGQRWYGATCGACHLEKDRVQRKQRRASA